MTRRSTPAFRSASFAVVGGATMLAALAALLGGTGCSSSSHNAAAPGCEPKCTSSGPSGSGVDTNPDAASDVAADVGEGGLVAVAVGGKTTAPAGLAANPSTANVDTTVYTVTTGKADGTTTSATTLTGVFSLANVGIGVDDTVFEVDQGTHARSLVVMPLGRTNPAITGLALPVYSDETINGACGRVGVVYDATKATVVVQLATQSPTGALTFVSGVTAGANTSGAGPFYDDGSDSVSAGTKTGTHGTFVFLNVLPSTATTTFAATFTSSGATRSVRLTTVAGAVTYLLVILPS